MLRTLARPMLASTYIYDGATMVAKPEVYAQGAEAVVNRVKTVLPRQYSAWLPTNGELIARGVGATKVSAAALLAMGKAPRLSATALALIEAPTVLSRYAFWETQEPAEKKERRNGLLMSLGTLGGLLLASADTAGKPGLVWRTNRAAQDANKAIQRALPTKSETEKFAEAASTQAQLLGESTKGFFQDASEKVADVASDVMDFVDDNKDDWLAAAQSNAQAAKKKAVKLAVAAQERADEAQSSTSKKAGKYQKQADKALAKAQKKLKKKFDF
ncbi:DoxX family protein [Corynebacterium sp. 13CS0277]|uniref:DoxX family membrane protein n=1 Tax=Corynebacterium sp. 13CS0277 TaxID=2071994 RepID=UPI000D03642F|nr:DoxX family membrane protein [Corynebacterium sp. 13CS0277]PRQ11238.1 DoxX family protein [Corynebacterium sp. 13CS0277]